MDIIAYYEKGKKYGLFEALDQNDDGEFDVGAPLKKDYTNAKDFKLSTLN